TSRTGIGETPPPETGVPLVEPQPTAFMTIARSGPAWRTRAIPNCRNPTIVTVPFTHPVPHGVNIGTVTTESLRLILFCPCSPGSGLLSPPSIGIGEPAVQAGRGALLQKVSCPMFRPRLLA